MFEKKYVLRKLEGVRIESTLGLRETNDVIEIEEIV